MWYTLSAASPPSSGTTDRPSISCESAKLMTVADQPLVLQFSEGRYVTATVSPKPGRGSWVYVWVRSKSGLVVYVGETSQDLVLRLRRSIGELAHTTFAQLRNKCFHNESRP